MTKTFYLAGTYAYRQHMKKIAFAIQDASDWLCVSSWLVCEPIENLSDAAATDLADIDLANVFIMNLWPHVSRGKYIELGYAIAKRKPICLFGTEIEAHYSSVFYHVPELITWLPANSDVPDIAYWLKMEEKRNVFGN